jgi:hypothetical protein
VFGPDLVIIEPFDDFAVIAPGTVNATVKFTNLGDNPVLAGPVAISGVLRFPSINGSPNLSKRFASLRRLWPNHLFTNAQPADTCTPALNASVVCAGHLFRRSRRLKRGH